MSRRKPRHERENAVTEDVQEPASAEPTKEKTLARDVANETPATYKADRGGTRPIRSHHLKAFAHLQERR